jgi:hypothetical protein
MRASSTTVLGSGSLRSASRSRVRISRTKISKKKLTVRTEVGGQTVAASEEAPRYLVESDKSGKEAAHKPDALSKA